MFNKRRASCSIAVVVFATLSVGPTVAQNTNNKWQFVPGLSSANLSSTPWELISTSALSWPDGRQAIVTFWRDRANAAGATIRCTAYFNPDMVQTGEKCEQPAE